MWAELWVLVQGLVRGERDEVRVVTLLHVLEVGVVEGEPVRGPGLAPGHSHASLAVVADGARGLRVLGSLAVAVAKVDRAAPLLEGPADGVRAAQGHDALVVEAHAEEDVAEVCGRVARAAAEGRHGVRQARVAGRAPRRGSGAGTAVGCVHPAVGHGDLRAARDLDGAGGGHLDEVGPGDGGVLGLDGLQEVHRLGEPRVRAVADLGLEDD
mmetsp:Transcript_141391/g.439438  ORF Transcript_141391/g.439438 Transcript_141391/m.439438 type:complete len:212 (+) Transcript_141391:221-856(+)